MAANNMSIFMAHDKEFHRVAQNASSHRLNMFGHILGRSPWVTCYQIGQQHLLKPLKDHRGFLNMFAPVLIVCRELDIFTLSRGKWERLDDDLAQQQCKGEDLWIKDN